MYTLSLDMVGPPSSLELVSVLKLLCSCEQEVNNPLRLEFVTLLVPWITWQDFQAWK